MRWEALLALLAELGCEIGQNASHGLAAVSRDWEKLAGLMHKLGTAERDHYNLRSVRKMIWDSVGEVASDDAFVKQICDAWQLNPKVYATYEALRREQPAMSPVTQQEARLLDDGLRWAARHFGLAKMVRAAKRELTNAKRRLATSFAVINATGGVRSDWREREKAGLGGPPWDVVKYVGRSCEDSLQANGMWGLDLGMNQSDKLLAVKTLLRMEPGALVLDVGAGCGTYLPALISAGVKVVTQDLLQSNIDFLRRRHDVPVCGSDGAHALSMLPDDAVDFVISNAALMELAPLQRCILLREALRVARQAVFIGWLCFKDSEWELCADVIESGSIYLERELTMFSGNVEYGNWYPQIAECHCLFAPAALVSDGLQRPGRTINFSKPRAAPA